ncbi:MAG TPA: HDOD domain-containing protein [Steroidobacteraceae bacterium]|nr:HDOD domain-containing protein [Steroidobacteraceae bacterium]
MSFDFVSVAGGSDPAKAAARAAEAARLVQALTLELASEKIDLPSFPEVAARARKALANEFVEIEDVVRIISAEPALAARLLQLANSAALNSSGRRIADLRQALSRIGFNMARSATIAFAMSQLRRAEAYKGLEQPLDELWQSSAHIAAVSHVVAKRFTRVNSDTALLAGLLGGIGKLYILTRAVRFPTVLADASVYQRIVAELHGRVAQAILRNWEIAEEVVEAVLACENHDREHGGATDLTDVLTVGRSLAALGPSPVAEQMLFLGIPAARRMKLDAAACVAALKESHDEIVSLRSALGD